MSNVAASDPGPRCAICGEGAADMRTSTACAHLACEPCAVTVLLHEQPCPFCNSPAFPPPSDAAAPESTEASQDETDTDGFEVVARRRVPALPPARTSTNGPAWMPGVANIDSPLYKTSLCERFPKPGGCLHGATCNFAHGEGDLRNRPGAWPYKTLPCRYFNEAAGCTNGAACRFAHDAIGIVPASVVNWPLGIGKLCVWIAQHNLPQRRIALAHLEGFEAKGKK